MRRGQEKCPAPGRNPKTPAPLQYHSAATPPPARTRLAPQAAIQAPVDPIIDGPAVFAGACTSPAERECRTAERRALLRLTIAPVARNAPSVPETGDSATAGTASSSGTSKTSGAATALSDASSGFEAAGAPSSQLSPQLAQRRRLTPFASASGTSKTA